ncbi:hypothetical protein XM38_020820 [Halomicronema hongdechloris C2206]|uniref:HTH gntR-type domain-containing protein n=1 Tax=Halomicronema hongdechloris C2206 TaxID=1641165 RepID=A0A1Z3HLD4_9CYAN|nr:hypothetical protein XM38_020820 [Halomicronema hongdechloris C2206]
MHVGTSIPHGFNHLVGECSDFCVTLGSGHGKSRVPGWSEPSLLNTSGKSPSLPCRGNAILNDQPTSPAAGSRAVGRILPPTPSLSQARARFPIRCQRAMIASSMVPKEQDSARQPLHMVISEQLRGHIESGKYEPGERLPSEFDAVTPLSTRAARRHASRFRRLRSACYRLPSAFLNHPLLIHRPLDRRQFSPTQGHQICRRQLYL